MPKNLNYFVICATCKKRFKTAPSKRSKYCSRKCYDISQLGRKQSPETIQKRIRRGKNHYNWKGGIQKSTQGYIMVYKPEHPFASRKYIKRATLVMEKYLGRYLIPPELVHHKNNIFDDDRIENLQLCANKSEHVKKFHPFPKLNRWAIHYDKCIHCGTIKRKHNGKGLCWYCYRHSL